MSEKSLTQRLQQFMDGKSGSRPAEGARVDELFAEIWPELYRVAARELGRKDRYFAPLSKTELISELWVRHLAKERRGTDPARLEDRHHFFAIAGKAMRHILVDCARKRLSQRRGGGEAALPLEESGALLRASMNDDRQAVEIGILMERLEKSAPQIAEVVDLHYFCGYTFEEIEEKTGITVKQARTRWEDAKRRLKRALRSARQSDSQTPPAEAEEERSRSSTMGRANVDAAAGLLPGSNS